MNPYAVSVKRHMKLLWLTHFRRRIGDVTRPSRRRSWDMVACNMSPSCLGCDAETVHHGHQDMKQLPTDEAAGRVRKKGGP